MHINELQTPAFLLDINKLEANIGRAAALVKKSGKVLCPMTKTHKSTEIARMQLQAGAVGFVVGTISEAEALAPLTDTIMLPYPITQEANLAMLLPLMELCNIYIAIDTMEAAEIAQSFFGKRGVLINYLLIVDTGLHRLGVPPDRAASFVTKVAEACKSLSFQGISTHPGHVYGGGAQDVRQIAEESSKCFLHVLQELKDLGFPCAIAATGSTPTFPVDADCPGFTMLRPGNYVFYDLQQMGLGAAMEEDCALTVLASIISHPNHDLYIMDCGSKGLGLDKGAHGSNAFSGHGRVLGHPELTIESLSEEVGKLRVQGACSLEVGDRVRILPNHACPVANLTSFFTGVRGDWVERLIEVDMRNNRQQPY